MKEIAVIALGGNSLISDKDKISAADQLQAVQESCKFIAGLVEKGIEVVITHGNGPQVGFNLLRSEAALNQLPPVPLDVCVAETQGSIGYMIQQSLINEYQRRGIDKDVVTLVTQVQVAENDPAFAKPSKPVGPFYDQETARKQCEELGWDMVEDSGRGYRRVVASPQPLRFVEFRAIQTLVKQGVTVIVSGGGGVPVVETDCGFKGTAAVIDKDRAASLLADLLKADRLIIPTAVSQVSLNYGKPDQIDLDQITLEEARTYLRQGHFAAGSMGPKIEAAVSFLERGGKEVVITSPELIELAVLGKAGTRICVTVTPTNPEIREKRQMIDLSHLRGIDA